MLLIVNKMKRELIIWIYLSRIERSVAITSANKNSSPHVRNVFGVMPLSDGLCLFSRALQQKRFSTSSTQNTRRATLCHLNEFEIECRIPLNRFKPGEYLAR